MTDDNKPLLEWAATTTPNPLGIDNPGAVTILATNLTRKTIDLSSATFSFDVGSYGKDLATSFDGVGTHGPEGWNFVNEGSGVFGVTVESGHSPAVGADGLQFSISGIAVNDNPGTTMVTIEEVTPDNRTAYKQAPLLKAYPDLTLEGPFVTPASVDYGGSVQVKWTATKGATVTLTVNGEVITHVKGNPNLPLPASGSYELDNITEAKTAIIATAELQTPTGRQKKEKPFILSLNAPTISDFTSSRVAGKPNTISVNWTATSVQQATLDIGSESFDVTGLSTYEHAGSLFSETVKLTVTNPATGASQSVTQPPAVANFELASPGPDLQPPSFALMWATDNFLGLLYTEDFNAPPRVAFSPDGQNWTLGPAAPNEGSGSSGTGYCPSVATLGDTVYVPQRKWNGSDLTTVLSQFSVSTNTWGTSQSMDWVPVANTLGVTIASDGNSTLYAAEMGSSLSGLRQSTDQGATWTALTPPDDPVVSALCPINSGLTWIDGTLYLCGSYINKDKARVFTYNGDGGWTQLASTGDFPTYPNIQQVNWRGSLATLSAPLAQSRGGDNTAGALQLFECTPAGVWSQQPASTTQWINQDTGPLFLGLAEFKDIIFYSIGPSSYSGGGVYMYYDEPTALPGEFGGSPVKTHG
ncbi:hypothetical protein [Pseudaestuariivita atlantica]|uniref:Uncharacterized protein n=1 Tax=Pseudaestuariivita atlantica TaxID=1317121 RepID=A0A0L1JK23_9RHOB|nr:hypothetical protein [Pseudaestuariivita atlantica]KNG92096.1 hypothetical protein ATO11_19040 [Pseudaestuariivita atlantica]